MSTSDIELRPRIISKIHIFILCFITTLVIDNKIPETPISIGNPLKIIKTKTRLEIESETISKVKSYCDLALLFYCLYLVVNIKTKKYKLNKIALKQEEGILSKKYGSIEMTHIKDFEIQENLIQRLIGVSTIRIFSSDNTTPSFVIEGVNHSEAQAAFEYLQLNSVNSMVGEMVRRRSHKEQPPTI